MPTLEEAAACMYVAPRDGARVMSRPWREAKTQSKEKDNVLKICGFVARTVRRTSASVTADAARCHFLTHSYFMMHEFGLHPWHHLLKSWADMTQQK